MASWWKIAAIVIVIVSLVITGILLLVFLLPKSESYPIKNPSYPIKNPPKILLCTNARDEYNILEWTVHHLNLGFSHIYMTDHRSRIPLQSVLVNIPSDRLTVHRCEGEILKSDLLHNAITYATHHHYDWMLYLDADEFLFLRHHTSVSTFLDSYVEYDQVGLNWLLFGTNGHDTFTGTILRNFTKSDAQFDSRIKTFLHIHRIRHFQNTVKLSHPHYYGLSNMSRSITCQYKRLRAPEYERYPTSQSVDNMPAYIAHYYLQSYERYVARKVQRSRDDIPNQTRPNFPKAVLHQKSNDVERREVYEKYNCQNIKSIQQYQVPHISPYTIDTQEESTEDGCMSSTGL